MYFKTAKIFVVAVALAGGGCQKQQATSAPATGTGDTAATAAAAEQKAAGDRQAEEAAAKRAQLAALPPLPGVEAARAVKFPEPQIQTLPNGLELVVLEDHEVPKLRVSAFIKAGHIYAPADQPSLAEFTLLLLGEGTKKRDKASFDAQFDATGGDIIAAIDDEVAGVTADVLTRDASFAFTAIAEQVMQPALPETSLKKIKDQLLQGVDVEKASPFGLSSRMAARAIYGEESPYGRPFPTTPQIEGMTREQALARDPETTFAALSTRGDWFLDGREGPRVDRARAGLFFAADRLQWLYEAVRHNPYEAAIEGEVPPPPPVPGDRPSPGGDPVTPVVDTPAPQDPGQPTPTRPDVGPTLPPALWPSPAVVHPLVRSMPASAEASIDAVGRFIAEHEPNRRMRIKALHDYVADRVAYDAEAYADRRYPPQDAETVFSQRIGVCAGYANLLTALGKAAGEEIVVVVGDARTEGGDLTGESHAWNAARIDDVWHLIDATWDAGSTEGRVFTRKYRSDYLFAPPEVFAVTHFPDEPNWQLLAEPLTRGDFFRAPMVRAEFFAHGLELVAPDRSQVTVDDIFEIAVDNPHGRFFLANFTAKDGARGECRVVNGPRATARCDLPTAGSYTVDLFVGPQEFGKYAGVAAFAVHRAR